MKKLISLLVLIAMGITAWAAETFEVGDLAYEVSVAPSGTTRGTVVCTGLSTEAKAKSSVALSIPYNVVNGSNKYVCKSITSAAFLACHNIRSARLYYGIETIGVNAFRNCTALTYVYIPGSVTSILSYAFMGCNNLAKISCGSVTPSSITLGTTPFPTGGTTELYCSLAASIDSYISTFGSMGFSKIAHSTSIFDYALTNGAYVLVTKAPTSSDYGELAIVGFYPSTSTTDASNGILKFTASTFSTTQYPGGMFRYTTVADSAFYYNTDLKEINMAAVWSLSLFGKSAAQSCRSLTSVSLGSGYIDDNAFIWCYSLGSVSLSGVTGIGRNAFKRCDALTQISIPATTTSIASSFVTDCAALTTIDVDADNANYSSYYGALLNKAKTQLIRVPQAYKYTALIMPETLTRLYSSCASKCTTLRTVAMPYGVTTIGSEAFSGCTSLTKVWWPSSVKSVADGVFSGCTSLTEIYANSSHTIAINKETFFKNVETSNIDLYLQRDMVNAFKEVGWTDFKNYNLGAVVASDYRATLGYTVTSTEPVKIGSTTYTGGRVKLVRHTGSSSVSGSTHVPYYITINGKSYAVTMIDQLAFNTTNSYSLTGCLNVDSIGLHAFYGQPLTGSLTLPRVSYIGGAAFNGTNITSVTLPSTKVKICNGAFYGASSLSEIVAPGGVEWEYEGKFFGENASDFNLYVPNQWVYTMKNSAVGTHQFNDSYKCSERIAPCFTATATTQTLAVQSDLDFSSSNLEVKPRYVTGFNASTGVATTSGALYYGIAGRAVLLTGLKVGKLYKIPRRYGNNSSSYTSMLVPVTSDWTKNIYSVSNAYYWDAENLKFVKPTSLHYVPSGEGYLVATGGGSEIYLDLFPKASVDGDVNGDGIVDITDVNMTINMVLGKVTKTSAGDINGDGTVDITDVNAVINLMLGK